MLEGKALVVAIMMLTAAPIAATDQGQAFIGDVTYEIGEVFNDEEEETKVVDKVIDEADIKDKELLLTDEKIEEDCLTLEQWKETLVPEEKIDEEKAEARGDKKESDKKESDEKKESDVAKEEWTDKKEVIDEEACLSAEEWALKFESDKDKKEPCFTIEELEEKMKGERKHHKKGWDRFRHDEDKDWDREDNDWDEDEEFRLYLAELSEACDEGDEESCEELLAVREELAADREEEDREREEHDEEERSRNSDESENEEVREDEEKEFDEETCLTMEEWKEILDDDKEEDKQWDNDRKEKGSHRDAFVREMMEELEIACEEEGNEEACENFEAMLAHMEEVEEKEGSCDKDSENLPAHYSIEGKWTFGNNSLNTMYLFEDGVRYTYYCVADDCNALYNSYEANDGNHIPGTHNYTVENNTLIVDLNFGNELVAPITFECNGGKVYLDGPNPYYLFRLNTDCN